MRDQWKSASKEYADFMYLVNNNLIAYEDQELLDWWNLLEAEIAGLLCLMEDEE